MFPFFSLDLCALVFFWYKDYENTLSFETSIPSFSYKKKLGMLKNRFSPGIGRA